MPLLQLSIIMPFVKEPVLFLCGRHLTGAVCHCLALPCLADLLGLTSAVLCPAAASSWLSSAATLPARSILRLPPSAKATASPCMMEAQQVELDGCACHSVRGHTLSMPGRSSQMLRARSALSLPLSHSPQHFCHSHWAPRHR